MRMNKNEIQPKVVLNKIIRTHLEIKGWTLKEQFKANKTKKNKVLWKKTRLTKPCPNDQKKEKA